MQPDPWNVIRILQELADAYDHLLEEGITWERREYYRKHPAKIQAAEMLRTGRFLTPSSPGPARSRWLGQRGDRRDSDS